MSDIVSTRTVCCKLRVDSAADAKLRETQAAFNAATLSTALLALSLASVLSLHVVRETKPLKLSVLHEPTPTRRVPPFATTAAFATMLGPIA